MGIEVEWARMTAPDLREIAARKGALAILPAGSLEQHGPHLPVITDTASASAASIAAARLVAEGPDPVPVAVLPGLWLGLSEHHLPFGGTISVDYAAYRAILESIVRSLRALGFARLLIVNGHGGNIDPLAVASRELAVAYDFPIVATTPWFLAPAKIAAIFESDTAPKHACEGETSVMMAIAKDIVKAHKLDEAMQQAPAPVARAGRLLPVLLILRTRAGHRHLGRPADRHGRKGRALPCRAGRGIGRSDPRPGAMVAPGSGLAAGPRAGDHGRQGGVTTWLTRRRAKSAFLRTRVAASSAQNGGFWRANSVLRSNSLEMGGGRSEQ